MDLSTSLRGGSHGEQRGLHLVGGFVVSETVHRQGQNLPRHAHERATINFVLGGAYSETFRGSSNAHGPDTIIVKPAGEQHANEFRYAAARCLLIEVTPARMLCGDACYSAVQAPASRDGRALKPIALRIVRELRAPDAFSWLAVEASILELLVASARFQQNTARGAAPKWLSRVLDQLHAAPAQLSLSQLAADANVHPSHLTRVFRKHYHVSPGEYARQIRLHRAIELLTCSDEPIGKIAAECGFFDQSHFNRCVKHQTGMTPRALRRSLRC